MSSQSVASTQTRAFLIEEILGRVLMLLWLYWVIRGQTLRLLATLGTDTSQFTVALQITTTVLLIVFSVLAVGLTLFRRPAKAVAQGWEPRVSALLGTYLMVSIPLLDGIDIGPFWSVVAIVVMIAGLAASAYCLAWLGRSYSIMATARKLVTAGPYRVVRHPLYAAEILTLVGVVIANFSIWSVLIGLATIAFLYRRMMNEEKVLTSVFPEYADYAQRVPRIIPSFSRPTPLQPAE